MSVIGELSIPRDLLNNIFFQLDVKSLGRVQCVSKSFYEIAGNDVFWQNIFKRMFDAPHGMTGKEALRNCIIIRNEKELIDTSVTFLCHLKWEKRTRLECIFPTNPSPSTNLRMRCPTAFPQVAVPVAIIEMKFGPRRGLTPPEFIRSTADETKYSCFMGNVQQLQGKPGDFKHTHNNIPCCSAIFSEIPIPAEAIHASYFEADIEGVNVGYGNNLGYYSSVNQWKEPFELFCVPGSNGAPKWTGRIPYSEFRFVKIDPNGKITWENIGQNRYWDSRCSGRPYSWEQYLVRFPVSFA